MPQVSVNSIGEYIREQREQAKISLRQLSQAAGVSNPYLSQIERGLRKPSADILQQIAKGLRISAEALYVQAGILEDKPADSGVRSALLADPSLSERQKQVLIEIYESFRKENGAVADGLTPEPPETSDAPAAIMAGLVTEADPGGRPGVRAARRARGSSSRNWATATGGGADAEEMPSGPLDPSDPVSQGGTGWPAAAAAANEDNDE
jgi:transcriptional regulator with XRE-family HTH domain